MIRMLILGYAFSLRSERLLCREVRVNLAYRWFCCLNIEDAVDASLIVADANKQRSIPSSEWIRERNPETASQAVKEYMATLNDAAFGAATQVTSKFVSPSDPAAQWTGAMRGPAFSHVIRGRSFHQPTDDRRRHGHHEKAADGIDAPD